MPGSIFRIRVVSVGDFDISTLENSEKVPTKQLLLPVSEDPKIKETVTDVLSTPQTQTEISEKIFLPKEDKDFVPEKNFVNGEWLLNDFDVDAISIGAVLIGCGGQLNSTEFA